MAATMTDARTEGLDVLIVEDDPLHRAYLREALAEALPECRSVIEAADGTEGVTLARRHGSAHVVMDLQMGARNGIEVARTIWTERPDTRILFWSNYSDEAYVRGLARIVPHGAAYGYVLKSASSERLKLALRSIFAEAQCVIDREVRSAQARSIGQSDSFTDSEYEVLTDIALGLTDRAIAARRGLSLRSIQNRLRAIYEKLGIYDGEGGAAEGLINLRARAVAVALSRRLLNAGAIERAEADLQDWIAVQGARVRRPAR